MTIYIDNEFKCHVSNDGTMREVEAPKKFNDKCTAYIEGHRLVPDGETWMREDGKVFKGEMLTVWRDDTLLDEFQAQYEAQQHTINKYEAALTEIETALEVTSE